MKQLAASQQRAQSIDGEIATQRDSLDKLVTRATQYQFGREDHEIARGRPGDIVVQDLGEASRSVVLTAAMIRDAARKRDEHLKTILRDEQRKGKSEAQDLLKAEETLLAERQALRACASPPASRDPPAALALSRLPARVQGPVRPARRRAGRRRPPDRRPGQRRGVGQVRRHRRPRHAGLPGPDRRPHRRRERARPARPRRDRGPARRGARRLPRPRHPHDRPRPRRPRRRPRRHPRARRSVRPRRPPRPGLPAGRSFVLDRRRVGHPPARSRSPARAPPAARPRSCASGCACSVSRKQKRDSLDAAASCARAQSPSDDDPAHRRRPQPGHPDDARRSRSPPASTAGRAAPRSSLSAGPPAPRASRSSSAASSTRPRQASPPAQDHSTPRRSPSSASATPSARRALLRRIDGLRRLRMAPPASSGCSQHVGRPRACSRPAPPPSRNAARASPACRTIRSSHRACPDGQVHAFASNACFTACDAAHPCTAGKCEDWQGGGVCV
jgi:hypothetical protein